jgi:ABC-type polysaccharide/polyol phosphate export permease
MNIAATLHLLFEWTRREFRIRYTQTLLGSVWALVQPIALTATFVFLFRRVANLDVGVPYASFVYPAMLVWSLFSAGVSQATTSMLVSMHIASKANYPRVVAPLSAVLLPLVDFAVGLLLLPVLYLVQHPGGRFEPLAFVASLTGAVLLSAGVGVLLSALTVFIRDIRNIVPLSLQLMLLVTPIAYPTSRLPKVLTLNPVATFVEGFRSSLLHVQGPSATRWVTAYVFSALLFAVAVAYFHRVETRFPDVA